MFTLSFVICFWFNGGWNLRILVYSDFVLYPLIREGFFLAKSFLSFVVKLICMDGNSSVFFNEFLELFFDFKEDGNALFEIFNDVSDCNIGVEEMHENSFVFFISELCLIFSCNFFYCFLLTFSSSLFNS